MILLRIINKESGVFIRDGFSFNEETEIGLDVKPAQGFIWPKWNFETAKWEEAGAEFAPTFDEDFNIIFPEE